MTPPLAVPSNLVTMIPVSSRALWKALTWLKPFWPVFPSSTSKVWWGAPGRALPMTRFTFFNSSIKWSCVARRPAVSIIRISLLRERAAWIASWATAAASPPSWEITSTWLRPPHSWSWLRAAARKVSPAASNTDFPCDWKRRQSLPIVVVLPAPLTPTTSHTSGIVAGLWV